MCDAGSPVALPMRTNGCCCQRKRALEAGRGRGAARFVFAGSMSACVGEFTGGAANAALPMFLALLTGRLSSVNGPARYGRVSSVVAGAQVQAESGSTRRLSPRPCDAMCECESSPAFYNGLRRSSSLWQASARRSSRIWSS